MRDHVRVVMTCNKVMWDAYGRRAAESFLDNWSDAWLILYVEDFHPEQRFYVACDVRDLPDWHTTWKHRHAGNPDAHGRDLSKQLRSKGGYSFRRDCVKFSHKIAALTHASRNVVDGLVIMMDADVITHRPVDTEWLQHVFPDPARYCAWLDRQGWDYPECGFVMFRADHPEHRHFMFALRDIYESDRVFSLPQTHDSFVLKHLMDQWVRHGVFLPPHSLSGARGRKSSHPLPVSVLGERLDHLKGKRKDAGRTSPTEAQRKGQGGYWGEPDR